jgi:hypothetical protein
MRFDHMNAIIDGWFWAAVGAVGCGLMAAGDALSDDGKIDGGEVLVIAVSMLLGAVGGRAVDVAARAVGKRF